MVNHSSLWNACSSSGHLMPWRWHMEQSDFWTGYSEYTANIALLNIYILKINSSFILITFMLTYYLFTDVIIFIQKTYRTFVFDIMED